MRSILVLFILVITLHAGPRTWTNRDGRTVTAELVAMDETTITIRNTEGKIFTIPRATLDETDQTFLRFATPVAPKEGKIAFDEGGRTIPQVTGSDTVFSGTCDLENANVTLSGTVSGTSKVTKGRWEIPVAPLETWAKGTATITATAELPGSKATTTITLHFINLLDEGAKGDGSTDDTAAINASLRKAADLENGIVFIPPGRNFHHADIIRMNSCELLGAGDSSVLTATDPMRSAIWIEGENPRVRNLSTVCRLGGIRRQSTPETTAIFIRKANHFWVDAVKIKGAASAGILNLGGGGTAEAFARITRCVVESTLADGIHNTASAHHVWVEGNTAKNNGDDCFAVVSYLPQMCHDIVIVRNKGMDGKARGIAVVGGTDIRIEDNEIRDKDAAGILVAAETYWDTNLSERIVVRNNRIDGCPRNLTAMAGIFLGGRSPELPVKDVVIEKNHISNSPCYGVHLGPHVSKTTVTGNSINDTEWHGIYVRASRDMYLRDNDISSCGNNGIYVIRPASGECLIQNNRITDINHRDQPENAAIRIETNEDLTKVEITGNHYKAGRNKVREEIVCKVDKAVIKGNR